MKYYRRRNEIELSYRTVKTELDGRRIRVWTMRNVRQKLMEKTVAEAKRLATSSESNAQDKKLYERVVAWARELTVKQLLDWFDCVERVNVKNRQAQHRWSTETTRRDQAFMKLFYEQSL